MKKRITPALLCVAALVATVALLGRPATAQIPVTDAASLKQQIIHYGQLLKDYHIQAMRLEMEIQNLKYLSTALFSRQFRGYYLRNQIFRCPWVRDYTNAQDGVLGNIGSQLAYFNSNLRALENGCLVDYLPPNLQAAEKLRKRLDKAAVRALDNSAEAAGDLRQLDQEIGQAVVWTGSSDEDDRTPTALAQKTSVNTMLTLATVHRSLITQDAILEAVSTANHATRDQIVERINSEYQRNANWDSILSSLR